eukprot:scaffold1047_cov126-Pinguiococcus_pyrenoidosus.AAC.2
MDGIFLSQSSGFVYKDDWAFEVRGNRLVVFLHHVEYRADKIHLAVQALDAVHKMYMAWPSAKATTFFVPKTLRTQRVTQAM